MKKLGTILTAAIMLFSSFAFATDSEQVNARVKAAFLKDFSTASNVSWEKMKGYYIVTFTYNNLALNAGYDEDGELVVTSREIELDQLPLSVSLAVNKKYEGYNFSQKVLESTIDGITNYYLVVVNDRQQLKLKCSVDGTIEVAQKTKKK